MTTLIKLETNYTADIVTQALARISVEEGYKRSIVSVPNKNNDGILLILPDESLDTRRVIMRTAIDLNAPVLDDQGNPAFVTEDNDVFFIEQLPSPEEEIRQVLMRAEVTEIREITAYNRLLFETVLESGFKFLAVDGGYSVSVNSAIILDIFYEDGDDNMLIEFDGTYAGAGCFLDACRFVERFAKALGGNLKFYSDDENTYFDDGDYEKLRNIYYKLIRQQLAYAFADDHDGLQAYIGWSGDSYEPELIPGSVVSCFGRFDLEKIKTEIMQWGFEAVADHHFLFRNHPNKTKSDLLKESILHLWCDISAHREKSRQASLTEIFVKHDSSSIVEQTLTQLIVLLYDKTAIPFPYGSFSTLLKLCHRAIGDDPPIHPSYVTHYPIGFLNSEVSYGFGSYLRHIVLPGGFYPSEFSETDNLTLVLVDEKDPNHRIADILVTIDYEENEELHEAQFLFVPSSAEWFECDIGGSAVCRYCTYTENIGPKMTVYCVSTVIEIRDERYYFKMIARDQDFSDYFVEAIKNSRAIEEVDDIVMPNPNEKPRAWGATFFKPIDLSFIKNRENLAELETIIEDHLEPIIKFDIRQATTTDISSKMGGQPFCPPDRAVDMHCEGFECVLQINFAEANGDGWVSDMPTKGLLQLWVPNFAEMLDADRAALYKNDQIRVVWYPEPTGGYVTENPGMQLCFEHGHSMPNGGTEQHRKLREFVTEAFSDWDFDMAEIAMRCLSTDQRIGGRAEYPEYPNEILCYIHKEDYAIIKIQLPERGGKTKQCIELLINRDDLRERKFENASLAFYNANATMRDIFFEDDEKYDRIDAPPVNVRGELADILDAEFVAKLRRFCDKYTDDCDVNWVLEMSDEELLYHLTHDKSGKCELMLKKIRLSKGVLKYILNNYDYLSEKYGSIGEPSDQDKSVEPRDDEN